MSTRTVIPLVLCHGDGELVALWDDEGETYVLVFTEQETPPDIEDLDLEGPDGLIDTAGLKWVPVKLATAKVIAEEKLGPYEDEFDEGYDEGYYDPYNYDGGES